MRNWKLVIDSKEAINHSFWYEDGPIAKSLPGTFAYEDIRYEKHALPFGDFALIWDRGPLDGHRLLIESKTYDDLVASMRDNGAGRADTRIRHQLRGLLEATEDPRLMTSALIFTVGVVTLPGTRGGKNTGVMVSNKGRRVRRSYSWFEIESALLAIHRLGIPRYTCPNEEQVPHALAKIGELYERRQHFEDPGLARVSTLGEKLSFLATLLTATPGVGPTAAKDIARKFITFNEFYEATPTDIATVKGVGKLTAERIWSAFHNQVGPDMSTGDSDLDQDLDRLMSHTTETTETTESRPPWPGTQPESTTEQS